jgi:hypothetical protein
MARKIKVHFKRKLSELLGIGHSKFGKVKLRKPYHEDEGGGVGEAGLRLDSHPLFANLPDGADSDLSAVANNNSYSEDAAKERVNEANPQLQMQPVLQNELNPGFNPSPDRSP